MNDSPIIWRLLETWLQIALNVTGLKLFLLSKIIMIILLIFGKSHSPFGSVMMAEVPNDECEAHDTLLVDIAKKCI